MDLTGLDAIEAELNKYSIRFRNKALRRALSEGSELVRAEAERLAPVGRVTTGWMAFLDDPNKPRLKEHIGKQISVSRKRAWARVGIMYKFVRHGHLVEFGARPHFMRIGNRVIYHPGIVRKQPFMRPAVDGKGTEAINLMGQILFDIVFGGLP